MNSMRMMGAVTLGLLLSACVTINVYFPAAAAERAADRIIDEVWGEQVGKPPAEGEAAPQTRLSTPVLLAVLEALVPAAQAQRPWYAAGAVDQTADGLVAMTNPGAVPLKDRAQVNGLVQQENLDRNALYREIALANGHPEWEPDIRATFARRWAERARREGW